MTPGRRTLRVTIAIAVAGLLLALLEQPTGPRAFANVLSSRTTTSVPVEIGKLTIGVTTASGLSVGQRVRVVHLAKPVEPFVEGVLVKVNKSTVVLSSDLVAGTGALPVQAAFLIAGQPGLPGPAGAEGKPGRDGAIGPVGPVGPTGAQGPAGPRGLQGIQGIQGLSGTNGANGSNGVDGRDGVDGVSPSFEWAYYIDRNDQPIAAVDTPQFMRFNYLVNRTSGISISSTTVGVTTYPYTKIVFAKRGIYNLAFSAQLFHNGNADVNANIWFRRNGITAAWSNTIFYLGKNEYKVAAWNFFVEIENPNDYVQMMWSSSTTAVSMKTFGAQGDVPETASLVLTISEVGALAP